MSVAGTVAARGQVVDVNESFIQLVQKSDSLIGYMGYFEANKGPVGFYADLVWAKLGFAASSSNYRNPIADLKLSATTSTALAYSLTVVDAGGLYEFARWPGAPGSFTALDGILGFRNCVPAPKATGGASVRMTRRATSDDIVKEGRTMRGIVRHWHLPTIAFTAVLIAQSVQAQNSRNEFPIPSSPADDLTAIQRMFAPPPPPRLTLFPKARELLQDLPPFLRDSKFDFHGRSYYRDVVTNLPDKVDVKEAWAGGGWVSFQTGRILDVVSGGGVFYTSLPLYAPLPYDGTQLLLPGQLGYDVVGQLYGKVHLTEDLEFTAGRYYYDTPYLGPNDTRMTPNTFYGYSLIGSAGSEGSDRPSFRYGAGYIATIKPRNANSFQSMSRAAGANVDNGVGVVGGHLKWDRLYLGAVEYFCQDTLNIAYAEARYGVTLPLDISAILSVQYADQRSTGASLANGGMSFATSQVASKLDLGTQTGILTLGYSAVNPGFMMQNPWSANPTYTDAMILSFQRAGEQAVVAGASYVFTPIGLDGVAASVFFYQGWTSTSVSPPTVEHEWDFEVDWVPTFKPLSGLSLRARYGTSVVNQGARTTTVDEARLILNYRVHLY
jgi:hypothetical protein